MKRMIRQQQIYAMSTIGTHTGRPSFTVGVNPDSRRAGLCYLKYYNSSSWNKAKKLARINLKAPQYVIHRNQNGMENWKLSKKDIDVLIDFLRSPCDDYEVEITNWQSVLYNWNREFHLLDEPFPREYFSSRGNAFIGRFYDTGETADHPSYMNSKSLMPDYYQLLK